jgi:hypothetical protein
MRGAGSKECERQKYNQFNNTANNRIIVSHRLYHYKNKTTIKNIQQQYSSVVTCISAASNLI